MQPSFDYNLKKEGTSHDEAIIRAMPKLYVSQFFLFLLESSDKDSKYTLQVLNQIYLYKVNNITLTLISPPSNPLSK
jgi:hypothetical protein